VRALILLSLLLTLPAEAQVVKCITATGKVEYREPPCPGNAKGAWVRTRSEARSHGGEPAAQIERRALAMHVAEQRAQQAAAQAAARSQEPAAGTGGCPQRAGCSRRR